MPRFIMFVQLTPNLASVWSTHRCHSLRCCFRLSQILCIQRCSDALVLKSLKFCVSILFNISRRVENFLPVGTVVAAKVGGKDRSMKQ